MRDILSNMNRNIVIIGMRGSGKTKIGEKIAEILGKKFIDFDREIEKVEKKKIAEIVKEKGWPYFREIEKKITKEFSKRKNSVIGTGGGTIIDEENRAELQKNGFIIFLKCEIGKLKKRLAGKENQPSLTDKNFIDEIEEVYKKRRGYYESSADIIFDVSETTGDKKKDIEEKARRLIDLLPDN